MLLQACHVRVFQCLDVTGFRISEVLAEAASFDMKPVCRLSVDWCMSQHITERSVTQGHTAPLVTSVSTDVWATHSCGCALIVIITCHVATGLLFHLWLRLSLVLLILPQLTYVQIHFCLINSVLENMRRYLSCYQNTCKGTRSNVSVNK